MKFDEKFVDMILVLIFVYGGSEVVDRNLLKTFCWDSLALTKTGFWKTDHPRAIAV